MCGVASDSCLRTSSSGLLRLIRRATTAATPGARSRASRARSLTSNGRRVRFGTGGSSSTSRRTVAGEAPAWRTESTPPSECPTRTTGSPATCCRNPSICRTRAPTASPPGVDPAGERPWPSRSSTSTRCRSASKGPSTPKFSPEPPSPCTQTTVPPAAGPPSRGGARAARPRPCGVTTLPPASPRKGSSAQSWALTARRSSSAASRPTAGARSKWTLWITPVKRLRTGR